MEPIFQTDFKITERDVDCCGRLMPSMILFYAQQVAGMHSTEMTLGYDVLIKRRMFWAVTRHKVQIQRLPRLGETIHVETWPMPTTRVAYPRSMVAYDAEGNEVFRSISLWVLMDLDTRNMILPGKSGISVVGTLRGNELTVPNGLPARALRSSRERTVCFTDLDRNGHMNNTRYMYWMDDLFSSDFHAGRSLREMTICYNAEAVEGQRLHLRYGGTPEGCIQVEATRNGEENPVRVFSARLFYDVL